jgi:hypothetical protein
LEYIEQRWTCRNFLGIYGAIMLSFEITLNVARGQERELFAFRHWKIVSVVRLLHPLSHSQPFNRVILRR